MEQVTDVGVSSNGAGASDDSADHNHRRVSHLPGRILVAALISGAFFASLSLTVVSLAVRFTVGAVSGVLPMVLIVAGTLVGAAAGGWFAQPLVTRLLAAFTKDSKKDGSSRPDHPDDER